MVHAMEAKLLILVVTSISTFNAVWAFGNSTQSHRSAKPFHSSMCGNVSCDSLIVQTVHGKVQGRAFESVLSKTEYYAFLGIPYAKPPLKDLRFRTPVRADSWGYVYPAYYERDLCEQVDPVSKFFRIGSEDCLYLNVYTPEVPNKITRSKPVIVSIHGGGFMYGTGAHWLYSPDYLVIRGVIIVSMNYRLSTLGFLNLGIPECSGNMGLKDQVLALQWVKENIASFGGDPSNITLFGESAGGTAVNYHLLSPMSKGLFHKAIIQSGSSMSPWGMTHKPIDQAFEIGRRCGYKGNDTYELLQYLKTKSSSAILFASVSWLMNKRQIYPARIVNVAPSIEVIKEGAFLPDWPSNLAKSATAVPTIFGVTNKEGASFILIGLDNQSVERVSRNFTLMLSDNFAIDRELVADVSAKIKKFYFGGKRVGMEAANELVDLYSDVLGYYMYDAIDFLVNSSTPPYLFEFAYNGNLNIYAKLLNFVRGTNFEGAAHGDDMLYLFYPRIMSALISLDDRSRKMIDVMSTMWTNFAKTGNPSGSIQWNTSTLSEPAYLLIDDNPRMVPGQIYGKRLAFLKSILDPIIKPGAQPYDIF